MTCVMRAFGHGDPVGAWYTGSESVVSNAFLATEEGKVLSTKSSNSHDICHEKRATLFDCVGFPCLCSNRTQNLTHERDARADTPQSSITMHDANLNLHKQPQQTRSTILMLITST
jgi:hypothetical protein